MLIDEAQMLRSQELMEDFRGLLNVENNGRKLVTFVLFGLPELDQVLALDKPLHQRVAMRYELTALNSPGTEAYVNYRLRIAGTKTNFQTGNLLSHLPLFQRHPATHQYDLR